MSESTASGPVLVVGARGRVGREVVRSLLARGARVRALVLGDASGLPAEVETCVGDLRDRASLDAALRGARAAFFVTPHDPDEEKLGAGFVDGSRLQTSRASSSPRRSTTTSRATSRSRSS